MNKKPVKTLDFNQPDLANALFGPRNQNLAILSNCTGVNLETRGSSLTLRANSEEDLNRSADLVARLYALLQAGHTLSPEDVSSACSIFLQNPAADLFQIFEQPSFLSGLRKDIKARSLNQQAYLSALKDYEMVFAIGPAGTGKTYLAVAAAVSCLLAKKIKRIILTRPAVEAGEKLGYLPGDLAEKVNPYLRPLYDALHDMLDYARVGEMLETGVIEVAPLAFMRGRTLNNSFIILDEAQNTTVEQMKMFLTRIGFGSRAVVTGDVTQIDLPRAQMSGLRHAIEIIKDVEGVSFTFFQARDVVRHPMVKRIVAAYERADVHS